MSNNPELTSELTPQEHMKLAEEVENQFVQKIASEVRAIVRDEMTTFLNKLADVETAAIESQVESPAAEVSYVAADEDTLGQAVREAIAVGKSEMIAKLIETAPDDEIRSYYASTALPIVEDAVSKHQLTSEQADYIKTVIGG